MSTGLAQKQMQRHLAVNVNCKPKENIVCKSRPQTILFESMSNWKHLAKSRCNYIAKRTRNDVLKSSYKSSVIYSCLDVPNMTYKTCVARHSYIFIWWPYLTVPCPLLSRYQSILKSYLLHTLRSFLAKFGPAAVISPILVADKAKDDLRPDSWSFEDFLRFP